MNGVTRRRVIILLVLVAAWAGGIAWRLAALQVEGHDEYRQRASSQQQQTKDLEPPRGTIYDARGRELAVSIEVDSVFADPKTLRAAGGDPEAAAEALAEALGHGEAATEDLAADLAEDSNFVWVERQVDAERAEAVRALELPGVVLVKEYERFYPMNEVAAQVLGFAGLDQRGLAGLEHEFDDVVAGREGRRILLRDARHGTAASPLLGGDAPQPGASLHLTLDAAIQHIAERELAAAVEKHDAVGGSVVVMDPETGAVLALASAPLVDANYHPEYPLEVLRNRPVMDAYEPGSTFKMVTAAAALSANVLDPSDEMDCQMGAIYLYGVRIRDHKRFGVLSFRDVLAKSSNVCTVKAGLALGDERLYGAIEAFGFGRPTGVELPGESAGALARFEDWQRLPLTKAYVSFGQGVAVTPLQLATAFAAVANGGELLRPYVVADVREPVGEDDAVPGDEPAVEAAEAPGAVLAADVSGAGDEHRVGERTVVGRPLAPATARELERMLEGVVESGTGRRAAVPGYAVAGKTGTAQKAGEGGYSARRFVASFVGFVPARRPRLVISVAVDEPWPDYHGGSVAAPVFSAIAEQALLYLDVPPDAVAAPTPPSLLAANPPAGSVPEAEALPPEPLASFTDFDVAALGAAEARAAAFRETSR